jgi:hypothetical protein
LPDGTKLSRRFRLLQTVQELFDFLDSEVGAEHNVVGESGFI